MEVKTFDIIDVESAAVALADRVMNAGMRPDVVVGIKSGGSYVGRRVAQALIGRGVECRFTEVSLQRRSTPLKKSFISVVLPYLPVWLLDIMRIAESKIGILLNFGYRFREPAFTDVDMLSSNAAKQILLVDDAVDSGATIKSVIEGIRAINRDCRLAAAAITVTTSKPFVTPDYYIYNNSTLIRFPWSSDLPRK